jgi:hypothetical protein
MTPSLGDGPPQIAAEFGQRRVWQMVREVSAMLLKFGLFLPRDKSQGW